MKYNSQDLLTLLIGLFIFSSCSNPSLVGLDIDSDEIQGQYTDTVTVTSYTLLGDTLLTSGSALTPFGYLKDPVIGESSASIAFAIAPLESGDSRLPDGITIDSAVLVMNYGDNFFGDSLASVYHIEVNQLQKPYDFGGGQYSNKQWEIESDLIGSKTVSKFAHKDSITISQNIDGKDTLIRVGPQLRIPMDESKLNELFSASIDSATFNDDAKFHEMIKGFYVSVNQAEQSGIGGFTQFAIDNSVNGIEIYYKLPDSTSQSFRRYEMASNYTSAAISHVYSTEVNDQLSSPDKDQATVYVQGLGGLITSVYFPHLEHLKDQNLVVNKAELVMYVDEDTTSPFPDQAPRLTLFRKDIAGQNMPIPDGDTRDVQGRDPRSFGIAFGGYYDDDKKRYLFTLTSYIQDILLGKTKNKEIYLTPASPTDLYMVPYSPSIRAASRAVLGGGSNPNYKMKLNIYFSKIK